MKSYSEDDGLCYSGAKPLRQLKGFISKPSQLVFRDAEALAQVGNDVQAFVERFARAKRQSRFHTRVALLFVGVRNRCRALYGWLGLKERGARELVSESSLIQFLAHAA